MSGKNVARQEQQTDAYRSGCLSNGATRHFFLSFSSEATFAIVVTSISQYSFERASRWARGMALEAQRRQSLGGKVFCGVVL